MKHLKVAVFFIAVLLIGNVYVFLKLSDEAKPFHEDRTEAKSALTKEVLTENYTTSLAKIKRWLTILKAQYKVALEEQRAAEYLNVIRTAFIEITTNHIIPYWYGTEWDFYGDTETPREGKIACGYFVSTVLRDAGLRLNRIKTAQLAAENIILSLTNDKHIRRYRNAPFDYFINDLLQWGEGFYLVGLDYHVGFILVRGGEAFFIHSSYTGDKQVKKEVAKGSNILEQSRYRVLGKLTEDENLLFSWVKDSL